MIFRIDYILFPSIYLNELLCFLQEVLRDYIKDYILILDMSHYLYLFFLVYKLGQKPTLANQSKNWTAKALAYFFYVKLDASQAAFLRLRLHHLEHVTPRDAVLRKKRNTRGKPPWLRRIILYFGLWSNDQKGLSNCNLITKRLGRAEKHKTYLLSLTALATLWSSESERASWRIQTPENLKEGDLGK